MIYDSKRDIKNFNTCYIKHIGCIIACYIGQCGRGIVFGKFDVWKY
jgi:hypothetical protein